MFPQEEKTSTDVSAGKGPVPTHGYAHQYAKSCDCTTKHVLMLARGCPLSDDRPNIFAYLDHRTYLSDWFNWKKTTNPRFSHRMFARLAKQKSPSLLLLVTKGERNLTPSTTRAFIRAMGLSSDEGRFFTLLVQFSNTANPDERNALFERIVASQRFQSARPIEGDGFRYLSHWFIPAVREMATAPGFQADPVWIGRTLRPRITPTQARLALQVLEQLNMVRIDETGNVTVADADLVTPHEVAGLAVHNYHRGMLERARDAIDGFKSAERHLGAVTAQVPEEAIADLKRLVAEFQERFLNLAETANSSASNDSPRRVIQMNLQLFPLTSPMQTGDRE